MISKKEVILYVSPRGNDNWSGKHPHPNRAGTDGPLLSIKGAQRAIHTLRAKELDRPVRVCLRGGRYEVRSPVKFRWRDSGIRGIENWRGEVKTPWAPIIFCPYEDEIPILSGGRRIENLRSQIIDGREIWVSDLPAVKKGRWYFHQLWVNGSRRPRACLPKKGFFVVEKLVKGDENDENPWAMGQNRFHFRKGDLQIWTNPRDIEVVFYNLWVDSHTWLLDIDEKRRIATLDRKTRNDLRGEHNENGARYIVENVFEALEEPGEWYLNRATGRLYYIPMPGEKIDEVEIIAPRISQLVLLEGKTLEDKPVEEIHFEGITFSHTEWHLPENNPGSNQAANEVPAAIELRNARGISFSRCKIANIGTYAIACETAKDIEIKGCEMRDLGAGGIKIWHGCTNTLVRDNEIGGGGCVFHSGVGVLIGKSCSSRVLHNNIHDFDYSGVSVGWCWGYEESSGYGNVVEYNHIHDIGRGKLSDMGGIYTLGISTGTRLRYNLIHDVESRGYGGWGIYLDAGSSFILVENNICHHTKSGGFMHHYGRENIVRNNIFAYSRENQLWRFRAEDHTSIIFEKNIVVYDRGKLWVGDWREGRAVLRNNLYFNEKGKASFPVRGNKHRMGASFEQWKKRGLDEGSLIADPGFVDAKHGDFRLNPDSPAIDLGFVPFDLVDVGPRDEKMAQLKTY
jgi:parallel beta-helix repeat protein